ncbi:MAG TPA: hypothetical protein VK899_03930 [Gemmatimonadales bacterium]|nr:hypothetical protein [Gemmatimonadales bacterium]
MKLLSIAVAVLLTPMACQPAAGNGGGSNRGAADNSYYHINVESLSKSGRGTHKGVNCVVTGTDAKNRIVEIEVDGKKQLYTNTITVRTPETFRVDNHDRVSFILVVCTMKGKPGESLHLEPLSADRMHHPPVGKWREIDTIPASGDKAVTTVTIHTQA